jgi:hypothetical protein
MTSGILRAAAWPAMAACLLASACAGTGMDYATSGMTPEQRAAAYASVDYPAACYKPMFDAVSASDGRTVIRGQTPIEREVCIERAKPDTFTSR